MPPQEAKFRLQVKSFKWGWGCPEAKVGEKFPMLLKSYAPETSMDTKYLPPMHYHLISKSNRAKPNSMSRHLPRPARGPTGAEALVLKRSRGLLCGVVGCPVGDVWPGGSESGGAKMSDVSKSLAGD